jgi:2-C-methyl-D-erythritol 4-phosphate cytidylyltransferase
MASDIPKQFLPLAGRPVLMHTIEAFVRAVPDAPVTVVLPADQIDVWMKLCREYEFGATHAVVAGGATRFESVKNGIQTGEIRQETGDGRRETGDGRRETGDGRQETGDGRQETGDGRQETGDGRQETGDGGLVAIHDGVRPLIRPETIIRLFEEAALYGSAVPVVTPVDSLRWQEGGGSRVIDRTHVKIIQTPQVFRLNILREAYVQGYEERFTDDATVWEGAGNVVHLCEGQRDNLKITTAADLVVAEALLAAPPAPSSCVR